MHYLKQTCFAFLISLVVFNIIQPSNNTSLYHKLNSEILKHVSIENPTAAEQKLITACLLLEQSYFKEDVIPEELWQSLTDTHFITHIIPHIQTPSLIFGKTALAEQATRFDNNIQTLQNKTFLLTYLENNPHIKKQLQETIIRCLLPEQEFLNFVQNEKDFANFYYQKLGLDTFNESPWLHEIWTRFNVASFAIPLMLQPIGEKLYFDFCSPEKNVLGKLGYNLKNCSFTENLKSFAQLNVEALKKYYNFMASIPQHIKDNTVYNTIYTMSPDILHESFDYYPTKTQTSIISGALTSLVYTYGAWYAYNKAASVYAGFKSNKDTFDGVYEQQQIIIHVSSLVRALQDIYKLCATDQNLQASIPEYQQLATLFDRSSTETSQDFKQLIQELLTASFDGDPSYYFSQQGKIIATYHLLYRSYRELTPYLQVLGHIDAYLATYEAYHSQKNHLNAQISIVNFIDQETPYVSIQRFWHPLINPWNVITNNLEIGGISTTTNLIITGPNAGGKTTALTALLINILLAQSFGIATASHMTLTPFTKLHSYLDITTNLLQGESLFKAEVNRSKKLKESILSCKETEKSFTIIDEIFSGTNQDVASKLALQFATLLGDIKNSTTIITTHIPEMTTLEETTHRFANYKVADAEIFNGIITYPFTLIPGISNQNIAQQMLECEGIL